MQRDGECGICASRNRLTAAHIIARRDGGTDTLDNLLTLCGSCHSLYESHVRQGQMSEHRRLVDALGAMLRKAR